MVLIDSTAPSAAAPGYAVRPYLLDRVFALVSASAELGLGRLYATAGSDDLPLRSSGEVRASGATTGDLRNSIDESADAGDSVKQGGKAGVVMRHRMVRRVTDASHAVGLPRMQGNVRFILCRNHHAGRLILAS
jgi:hypothetical protein